MRAMILAAGRGMRMGELTTTTPKPLLRIGNHYLIEYAINRLRHAGIKQIVINVSHLGGEIKAVVGDGRKYGCEIVYSEEKERLETGGGIVKALPLLGDAPFLVLSADVITDYPLVQLPKNPSGLAHLVMVDNPPYHLQGDFGIQDGFVSQAVQPRFTFANIGVYRKELFLGHQHTYFPLSQLLLPAIDKHQITGEHYQGIWYNIGTPSDLRNANVELQNTTLSFC